MYDRTEGFGAGAVALSYAPHDEVNKNYLFWGEQALEWVEEVNVVWKNNYFSSDPVYFGKYVLPSPIRIFYVLP
jgi:hypothetical protein